MNYELKTERFSGPLSKLLELIEEKKLEITEISLAEVTDDFLTYLKKLEKVEVPILADFIAVASRLVFLKSRSLLPGLIFEDDEEEGIKDLERRLKAYRELKPAIGHVHELWLKHNVGFSRPYLSPTKSIAFLRAGFFYPGEQVNIETILASLYRILDTFKSLELETETIREKVITLEEKITEVIEKLKNELESSFGKMISEKVKAEIIVIFLAILHLARDQRIHLTQEKSFSDIIIRKSEYEQ